MAVRRITADLSGPPPIQEILFMNVHQLLEMIEGAGISIWLEGSNIAFECQPGRMTPSIAGHIRTSRIELICALSRHGRREAPTRPTAQPISSLRHELKFFQQMAITLYAPATVRTYNLVSAVRIHGRLRMEFLAASLRALLQRHEILRSRFDWDEDGNHWLCITEDHSLHIESLRAYGPTPHAAARAFGGQPFQCRNAPMLRLGVGEISKDEHLIVLVMHHAIADGWSLAVAWSDLLRGYNWLTAPGIGPPPRSPLALQFTDVMRQQRDWLDSPAAKAATTYWRSHLHGCADPFLLPYDQCSGPEDSKVDDANSGALVSSECADLFAYSRHAKVSLATLTLTCFAILLARWSGRPDVVTWVTHAGRQRADVQALIGCFFDTWLLRARLAPDIALRDALKIVNAAVISALPTLSLPGAVMCDQFENVRGKDLRRVTLFNFMPWHSKDANPYVAAPTPAMIEAGAVSAQTEEIYPPTAHFEPGAVIALYLTVQASHDAFSWSFRYDPMAFSTATIRRISSEFGEVLRSACSGRSDGPRGNHATP